MVDDLKAAQSLFQASISLQILKESLQRRRFLVYVQCSSQYSRVELLSPNRNFDVMLNYYDEVPPVIPSDTELAVFQRGTKCTAIWKLLQCRPDLLKRYEYVLFLDDDIFVSAENIGRMFREMAQDSIHLAQPCLSDDSPGAWPALKNRGLGGQLALVNAIEIMMPCLSRAAILEGGWVFENSVSGYGVDLLLCSYLSRKSGFNSYLFGSIIARHERNIDQTNGRFYKYLRENGIDPLRELSLITSTYGLTAMFYRIYPSA